MVRTTEDYSHNLHLIHSGYDIHILTQWIKAVKTLTLYFHLCHRGEKERMVSVHDKHLLAGIKALCRGSGALHRADQTALTAAMKAAKLPPHIKTVAPGTPPPTGLL